MTPKRTLFCSIALLGIAVGSLNAEERTHTAEQMEALAKGGDLTVELSPKLRNQIGRAHV